MIDFRWHPGVLVFPSDRGDRVGHINGLDPVLHLQTLGERVSRVFL
jgi:hypothetical protein